MNQIVDETEVTNEFSSTSARGEICLLASGAICSASVFLKIQAVHSH